MYFIDGRRLNDLIELLIECQDKFGPDAKFIYEKDCDGDAEFFITYEELETDKEYKERISFVERKKQNDIALMKKLMKLYPDSV